MLKKQDMWTHLTWLLVADVDIEGEDDKKGDEGRPPVDDEHDHTAQYCPRKRHPHVVVFEAGAPPCGGARVGQILTEHSDFYR